MDTEQHRDKVDDPSSSMTLSPQNTDDLQGIYVYQLPFPGTLPEKAQREQLAAVVRKYSKIVEIRFDAVPNNPDMSTVQAGRRFQLPPLSRRALIVFQKISTPSCEALLAELNKQIMSQCHLNASMAKSEHISALIALRNSSAGHNAAKPSTTSEQPQQYPSKRPLTLLKIQPPAPAVKAFAMDSQTHTQPDPFHKNASRTLYVKHLDNAITEEELKIRYGKFGHILDIEVKNRNTMAPYAFIQFTNIESVANAIKAFNHQMEECGRQKKNSNLHWWGNTIVTSRLWIGRLPPNCGEQYLMSKMRVVLTQPDDVTQVIYDANFNEAIVMFVGHESTQIAFNKVKNRNITFQPERSSINEPVHHVHVDFCSEKLHDYFIDRLYGKNTEPLLSDVILAPPPDPPKCLSTSQLKKSPSPPPDPSIEGIGNKHSVARPKVLLAESQQQNAACAIEKALSANSYSAKTEHPHHSTTTKPSARTIRDAYSNSMAEEASSHRERPAGKSQDTSERQHVNGHIQSVSSKTHKMPKKQSSATKHTWDRKHRSQRSTERRRESRVEKKEKRREKRRSRTRQTAGNVRRTEVERSGGEIVVKQGQEGSQQSCEVQKPVKRKSTHKSVLQRIDKAHEQQKRRRPSSSSDSHSSCTCSSCTSNSSSNSRSSSLSENSDSDYSSTENEAEEERPSTRRSNQSKKDGLTDEPKIANSQPVRQGGTTTVEPVLIHNDPLPLTAPLEVKASDTEHPTKTTGLEIEKTIHNESTEENSSSKDKDVQLQCKDPSAKDDVSKKSSTASLAGQQPQSVTKVQAPKTSLRTIVCIPLEALSTPSSDPRLNRLKPSSAVAVSLDLPRFVLKLKMGCSSGNRLRADSTNLQEQLLTNTPVSAPPQSADWIKQEPEFNAEIEQKCKIKNAEQNENDSEMEKKSVGPNTLNLLAAITKRIKCVESGITELKISARPEQIKLSNFDQIESEVSRIRTELISGVSMEQLEHSIAQRSPITAQLNTSSTDGGGRPLQPKTIIDGFQTSNLLDFVITKGEDEAEKNSKSEDIEGGLHDRRCSFVSEPDMPTRSFSLSNELQTTAHFDNPSASSNKVRDAETIKFDFPRHTPSAKVLRLAHEKEQLTPSTSSSASPLPKQSVDANSAFSRKSKLLMESSPNQQSHQIRTTVGIPKLKEIKLDRKPSAVSLVTPVDPWATTSTPHGSTRKDKELKSERREYRSDSVGHLPITMAKDRKEGKNETIGGGLKTNHPILKKTPTTTTKSQQKQSREERKTDSAAATSGAGCGGHVEQHKKHFKSKAKSVENESTSDVEKQHRKQKRKKRAADQSTSSSSDESVEGMELFNKVDIEEQKRMMKAIKSGVGFGLSMYDRVKRRSSQRPDDDHKKKTALEVLKTKHAKKKKEFSRVRLSSTSTDSDESEDDAANRKEEDSGRTDLMANNKQQDGNPSSSAENVEPAVIDDSALSAEKQPKKHQNAVGASAEAKGANTSNLTIRRPEIAPRKPFMEEPKIKEEEEEEANSSASCIDGSGRSSESESEAGDEEMDAGDRAIKKDELSRYRKSSESSVDEAKLFNENLARVVATAAEGCRAQSTASHTENDNSSSESSSSSPSESDTEPITNRLIGNVGMSTKPPSQKRVKHLSMEDVFGADSSEESLDEHVPPAPKVGLTTAKNKPVVISSFKNDNIKKEVFVPKIKIDQKEASETSIGKEKMQIRAILAVNKQGKRTRVSSVSSVSSIEHKRFKETKSKISAENEPTSAVAAVRDRSKSDATPLKKAQLQMKPPTTGTSSEVTVLSKEEGACATAEMGKKMKQQTKTIGTKISPKTSKNAMLMKELAKRKRVKIREEKKLNKSTLKRAIGSDKGQTPKRARTEKMMEPIVDRTEWKDKKKVGQEELQSVKSAIADTAQCLDVSIATKLAENDESDQRQHPSIVQQEEHSGEVENLVTVASRKNETDELMDIVAAEKMAESEFEIIDSGNVLTKVAATDKTPDEELKQQKTEEMEVKNKTEEKDGQKKSEEKDGQKKSEEKDGQKKGEEEMDVKNKTEEKDGQKKSEEKEVHKKSEEKVGQKKKLEEKVGQKKKSEEKDGQKKRDEEMDVKNKTEEKDGQNKTEEKEVQKKSEEKVGQKKKEEEKVGQKKKEEEKVGQKKKEEEKDGQKKRGEEATELREIPAEEDDEEQMEAELLRRMEECNEEEAAVASLRLQSKVDRRNSQDLTQKSDDIGHILSPNEKHWKTLDMEMEKEEIPTTKDEEEENKEEDKLGGNGERVVEEEREVEGTLHGQHTAVDEPTTDKTTVFKFETIERRASNESVDSHMAGVGNGFVEVDAEHLRQQKRDQDAMERLAEERRKTEETVKRMDETVDAVATNSTVLQQHDITSGPQTSPDLAQQLGSFQPLSRQPNALQTAADAFPQQPAEGGDVGDYLFPTTMGMGRAQNQQQCEAVIQTVTANPMSMNIQSQYLQQQQPIHSLQHHFSLPSASVVEDVLSVSSGEAVCKTASSSTTTTSSYPFLMPTTSTMSHHQQQQQQHQYGQQHKLQHTHHMPQQQQHYSSLPQQKPSDVSMMESVSMSLPPSMPVGPPPAYDVSAASMADSSHQESAKNVASYQQQLQSLAANSTVYTHQPQISSGMSDVVHQQGMANVFEGLSQDKSHLQQKQKQQSIAPMMLQQRKPSDVKQQQLQHQPAPIVGHNVQQSPLVQPHQGLTDRRLDVQTQQLQLKQPQQQQFRLEQMQLQQQPSRLDPLQQQQSRLEQLQHHQQPRLEQMQPQQPRLEHVQPQQQQTRLDPLQQQQSRLDPPQQHQSRLDQIPPQQQQSRLDPPQQQQSRDQIPPQQRQQFQMQHIVQPPSAVQKQQQLQQQQQYQQKQHQLSSNALTPVLSTQQVQQTKQQNVVQRQRRQQQMPTIPTQQQQQKQLAVSGQYHHQQQQQQHHHIPQQQHYQQQPDTLSTMATTGLIDPQLVSLYQHLRDQQMIQQEISKIGQAQQMPSISAAMLAAASSTNQITPATLSQWHSIVTPTSTMAHGGALEELLRHGLLAPQTPSIVSPSGRTENAGTSAMAVPSSFDELFHQKLSGSSPSPRGFLQHHQQMSSNVPQLNATHMAQQQQQKQQQVQQQQMQQNLLAAGGSVQNKQIQPIQQQQPPPPGQQQQQPSIMCHSQNVEKRQQQHVHANQHIVQQNQQKMVKKQSSANKYPVLWQGQLAMKNADTLVQMHKVCGNEALIQQMNGELSALNENGIPLLRINQRMRLEQTHLENLIRKMEREENQLALICLPCGRDREDVVIQTQKMSVAFIEYFSSKSAAGIVSSGATQQPSSMVAHIFPPSDFSRMLLSRNAPDLLRTVESLNAGYLFVILTNK
uniref:Msx2-interacting protein n=1 Tax=Globodera rostochiensis TaxID=31243 RepID=A0A914GR31_GLORO